jgi:hypothetical protein
VRRSPGKNANSTCTGDWPGAESRNDAVDPLGIPASHGSDVPGTIVVAPAFAARPMANAAAIRVRTDTVPSSGKTTL